MSDSSEEEDLSRFRDVVDNSFTINAKNPQKQQEKKHLKSERYLEEASHYNDVKVPEEMAKKIGAKVSAVIERNIQFVDVEPKLPKKRKIKGGVKLFKDSEELLSWKEAEDTFTPKHNEEAKRLKTSKVRKANDDLESVDEDDKIKASAVTPDFILSKEDTKCWKSRRKEKIFKYKQSKNKVLVAIE